MADAEPDNKSKPAENVSPDALYIKVYSPYQVFYDGQAQSMSAENDTGPFDILPRHHNFMTLVNEGEIVIRSNEGEDKRIRISKGVLHVRSNKVTLFLDV
jgi:F0F1-type ATP synthase epsilon subunit